MAKKCTALILATLLLLATTTIVSAKSVSPADVTGDGARNMMDVLSLYAYVSGSETLSVARQALADVNSDSAVNMTDVLGIYGAVSGTEAPALTAVWYDAAYIDIANAANNLLPYNETRIITSSEEWEAFQAGHNVQTDWYPYFWNRLYNAAYAMVVVPLAGADEYVASVTADDDTVYITMVAMEPGAAYIERTAYAMITVLKEALENKTVKVKRLMDDTAVLEGVGTLCVSWDVPHAADVGACDCEGFSAVLETMDDLTVYEKVHLLPDNFSLGYDEAFFEENVLLVSYYAACEDSGHIVGPSYYTATEDRLLLTMDYAQYPVSQSSYQGMEQHFMCQTPLSRDAYQGQEIEQVFRCRLDECCILFHTDG